MSSDCAASVTAGVTDVVTATPYFMVFHPRMMITRLEVGMLEVCSVVRAERLIMLPGAPDRGKVF
jgi:hypothetical protein